MSPIVKLYISAFTFPLLRNTQVRARRKNTDMADFIYFLCNSSYLSLVINWCN